MIRLVYESLQNHLRRTWLGKLAIPIPSEERAAMLFKEEATTTVTGRTLLNDLG